MSWVDYAIVVIILVSALISLWRGFVREALSLTGWILAFWVGLSFADKLATVLTGYISVPSLRFAAAFAALFLVTLVLAALVSVLVSQLVDRTGLKGTDRMVGVIFGMTRGVLVVAVLVLLASLTTMPQDPWWQASLLVAHFQDMALWLRGFLPEDAARNFVY